MSTIEKRLQVGQVKPLPKPAVDGLSVAVGLLFVALTIALAGWVFSHTSTMAMPSVDPIFMAP